MEMWGRFISCIILVTATATTRAAEANDAKIDAALQRMTDPAARFARDDAESALLAERSNPEAVKRIAIALRELLESKDRAAIDRMDAAHLLGQFGPAARPIAEPALISILRDEKDRELHISAVLAIGRLKASSPDAVNAVVSLLESRDPDARGAACVAIMAIGPDAAPAVKSLIPLTDDSNQNVRLPALNALAAIGPAAREAVPVALRLLKSTNESDRAVAAAALGWLRAESPQVVAALTSALGDPSPAVMQEAAAALGRIGPPAAGAAAKLEGLQNQPDLRLNASFALARINGSPSALRTLGEMASADDAQLVVFERLTELGPPAVPLLADVIRENRRGVRWAIDALANIGPAAAKEGEGALVEVLRAGRSAKRRTRFDAALNALQKVAPPADGEAATMLRDLAVSSDNAEVRTRAAAVLATLQNADGKPDHR